MAYVYGELEGDALREVEDSLEPPECRQELWVVQATLARARAGLDALDSSPPPRVRLALIDAARATIERNEREARARIVRRRWTYRALHWALPAVVIMGALALLLLSREEATDARPVQTSERAAPSAPHSAPPAAEPARDDARSSRAPDAQVRAAQELLDAHRVEDAARAYLALLEQYPSDPRAASWRARLATTRADLTPEAAP